jgi:hypothetical protein
MYLDRDALTTEKNKLIQETNGDKWNDAKVTWRGHTMTKGEVVDILAANKDPHIKQSMQLGGINRLDRNGNINEAYSDEAISELESLLTPDELKAVDKVFSIYHSKNFTDMLAETNRVNRGFPGTPNPTYYPDTSSKGSKALSVNGDDPITAMLSSGTSVNAIQRVRINPNGFEVMDYRDRLDSWINSMTKNKDMGPALRKCYRILNKKVDLNGRRTSVMKEIRRVYGTRANKMIKTFFEKANEAPRKIGGLTKVTSMGAVGVLAINLPSAFVQPASYFTASNTLGIEPIAKNLIMPSTYSNLKSDDDYLLKNSGYYINHVKDQEYIKATTLKKRLNKIQSAALSLQGLMDRFTNLMTFEACQRYVARMNPSLKVHTDDCRKAALPYYAIALQETQSNAIPWATNDVRYGNAGDLMQGTFGMFAADPQAKASNALKSLRKYLLSFQIRKEAGAKMNDQSYSQEERDRYSNWYKKADEYIKTKGPKETLTYLAALTASGLFAFGVYDFFKRLYGKKEWNDWDPATMTKEAFIQSYVDWVPVVGDIYNAFDTSNSLEPFSLSLVNDTITSIKKIYSAIKSGNVDNIRKACLSGGLNGSQISGLPLKNIYNLAYGILNVTDKSKAIEMKSAFYDVASTASAKMNKAIASGDDKTATAYMNSLMSDRVGTISADEQKEILALLKDGENVLPSGVPDTYKDSNGSEVTISWTDKQSIKRYYAKANEQVSKMIQSSSYSSLTNAQKAYAIRMVYSAYREAGLAKAIPSYAISSKASYLAKAGLNMAFIESAVAYIKGLEATKDKTKKELALAYVNKLSMSKAERLIVLYLCGYAPSDTSSIKSYLSGKGLSSKEINAFLGENKA